MTARELAALQALDDLAKRWGTKWVYPRARGVRDTCRRSLESKGLVAIDRLCHNAYRYRLTQGGRTALEEARG